MQKKIIGIFVCIILITGAFVLVPRIMSIANRTSDSYCYNMQSGFTTLISDGNDVIEVNDNGEMVWDYLLGSIDSERLENGNTLIGSGLLVKEIDFLGNTVWLYGTDLLVVSDVERLENNNTLITDFSKNFVREVDFNFSIVWEITGLSSPMDAERLENGNTLIVNNLNGRVIEVDNSCNIVWEYASGVGSGPTDAERLSNSNTLITEQLNDRVIEVDSSGNIVWELTGLAKPRDAERLENGNTLIVEFNNHSVIEVDNAGNVVWSYQEDLYNPNDAERLPNYDPLIPDITGPDNGRVNIPYSYIITGEDPNGYYIFYWVDWGDGLNTGWRGPYLSGTPTTPQTHCWTTKGIYTIKAKIKDVCDVESDWASFEITIPRNKAFLTSQPILQWFFERFPILKHLMGN